MKKSAAAANSTRTPKQRFPRGWNQKRVQNLIKYYDKQTEDKEVAEYEAGMRVEGQSIMFVPTELIPAIRQLIARRRR